MLKQYTDTTHGRLYFIYDVFNDDIVYSSKDEHCVDDLLKIVDTNFSLNDLQLDWAKLYDVQFYPKSTFLKRYPELSETNRRIYFAQFILLDYRLKDNQLIKVYDETGFCHVWSFTDSILYTNRSDNSIKSLVFAEDEVFTKLDETKLNYSPYFGLNMAWR